MFRSRPKVENNGGFPAFQRRFLEQNPPLTRSKSESELETDAERERTIPIKGDNSDSLSNASDDLYMDPSLRNMKILENHQQQNQKMLRFSHDTSYSGSSDHQPPPASPHSNIASLIQAKFEASARRFNAIESSDHLQESSCTTPLTSWSSHPCTSEGSNRNSVSSYQSHHSSVSVPLSQTQSFQQSLDSGYGTNNPNNPSIDSALPSPQVEYHLPPMQQSTASLKLEVETQTDSGESHEYTELDGSVVMRPKPKGNKKDRPPPVLPIPPPPNKPLPPLPENGIREMSMRSPRAARRRQLKPIPKGTQKNEVGAQNGRPLVSTNV